MIAVIPARRGSKSIPGKNHRRLAGRPLVAWSISAALEATLVQRVLVTTDDPRVAEIAVSLGAEIHHRSPASATDTAPTEDVLIEVLDHTRDRDFALLQATSPLTTAADIDGAVAMYRDGAYESVLSVAPQTRFIWAEGKDGAVPVNYDPAARPRRQECVPVLVENGAIYVSSTAQLRRTGSRVGGRVGLFRMHPDTYYEIDDPGDWEIVNRLLAGRQAAQRGSDLARIKLVISDVDGVLTDNGMYWLSDGTEAKRFSARDGKGFELLHQAGVKTALITSEALELVALRGRKLGCYRVVLGCSDKVAAADVLRQELRLSWTEVAFIGDDVHDLELMQSAGIAFAPSDAVHLVRDAADDVLTAPGGAGCFRELADRVIAAVGDA